MNTTQINTTNEPKPVNIVAKSKDLQPKNLRELIGKITDKVSAKVYSHKRECWLANKEKEQQKCLPNCNYGSFYYKLTIACENKPEVKQVMVFKDLLATEKIWKDIESTKYYSKTYAFDCSQWMKIYRLVNWREINSK